MRESTCAAEGCERPAIKLRWCGMHYQRLRNHGDANWQPPPKGGTCSIDGCTKPVKSRGWCVKHYTAWLRHDDPEWQLDMRCSVEGCERPRVGHGYCALHWGRWYRHGSTDKPTPKRRPLAERFWERVDKDGPIPEHDPDLGPCWLWTGGKVTRGYGLFFIGGRQYVQAHRYAYEHVNGSIPDGLEIMHRCDNPSCVRAEPGEAGHLRAGTHDQNMKEMQYRRRSGNTECGTSGGYRRHLRLGEAPCEPCREAQRVYARRTRRAT